MKTTKKRNPKIIKNIAIVLAVYFVCSAFYGIISQISDYNTDIAALNRRIAEENEINKGLKEDKLNMHSDENYKKIARKTLGLVEPGDKVYINTSLND